MKLFTTSQSNFVKVNNRNIDFKKYLDCIWKPEVYYKNQFFKEPCPWTPKQPGLLQQYIAQIGLPQAHQIPNKPAVVQVTPAKKSASPFKSAKDVLVKSLSPTILVPNWLDEQIPPTMSFVSEQVERLSTTSTSSGRSSLANTSSGSSSLANTLPGSSYLANASSGSSSLANASSGSSSLANTSSGSSSLANIPPGSSYLANASSGSSSLANASSGSSSLPQTGSSSLPFKVMRPGSPYPDYQVRRWSVLTPHTSLHVIDRHMVKFTKDTNGMFEVLGSGASGSVYHASLLSVHQLAIKLYNQAELMPHMIINEAMIMNILQHLGVVPKFYGLMREPGDVQKFTLVQEYFGNGTTLFKLIGMMNRHEMVLNEKETIRICYQLVHALKVIHSKGVIVNDIKSDNVLVDIANRDFTIRFIDFGLATFGCGMRYGKSDDPEADQRYSFLAPEVRQGDYITSKAADIYSLGILIGEVGWRIDELEDISDRCKDPLDLARPNMDELITMMDGLINQY